MAAAAKMRTFMVVPPGHAACRVPRPAGTRSGRAASKPSDGWAQRRKRPLVASNYGESQIQRTRSGRNPRSGDSARSGSQRPAGGRDHGAESRRVQAVARPPRPPARSGNSPARQVRCRTAARRRRPPRAGPRAGAEPGRQGERRRPEVVAHPGRERGMPRRRVVAGRVGGGGRSRSKARVDRGGGEPGGALRRAGAAKRGATAGRRRSPRPSAHWAPPRTKKGTSEPTRAATASSASSPRPSP